MQAKEEIQKLLSDLVVELIGKKVEVKLEHPAEESHGDYSSNVAMVMFSDSKFKTQKSKFASLLELAEAIVEKLEKNKVLKDYVEKIEVAKPGFINFWLSKPGLESYLQEALSENFGLGKSKAGHKVMIEFTDPNPFKEFHVGHVFTNTVGEALARLFESQGANVKRANYQGDVGLHVAKAIFGIKKQESRMRDLENATLKEKVEFLGQAYAEGARAYDEDEKALEEIRALNKKIYELDEDVREVYEKGRIWSLEAFEKIYSRLGTKFDFYYFERETGKIGEEYVRKHLVKGVFIESEGAIIFPGEQHGLHNRVFVNSQGLPTYEAKDLGLAETKYRDFPYDESYIITGNEIKDYFKVIIKVLSLINPELGAKTKHVAHGMLRLPEGKMSSRTGQVIIGEWLLDEAKNKLMEVYPEMEDETADQVAVGAVKCALLKSTIGSDVVFDFARSLSFEGDSGPYLQYTHARCRSLLQRAGISNIKYKHSLLSDSKISNLNTEELSVLRYLYRFPEVVENAAKNFAPNTVCNYLFELAGRYNAFYNRHRILDVEQSAKNQGQREFRLALTEAAGNILKTGLYLLGIKAPVRM